MTDSTSSLGEVDLHLIGEGRHHRLWEALGANLLPTGGVRFSVWAPNAHEVRLVGDFNGWDRATLPMTRLDGSGVWQLTVPEAVAENSHLSPEYPRQERPVA